MGNTDWIKMRTNLDTDPRVFSVARATGAHPAHVVGALHWLWSQADRHTASGKLWGLDAEQVDSAVGIQGFSKALTELRREGKPRPWLEIGDGYVAVLRFGDHNGDTAKRRAQGAVRASRLRNAASARNAHLETETETDRETERDLSVCPPAPKAGVAQAPPDLDLAGWLRFRGVRAPWAARIASCPLTVAEAEGLWTDASTAKSPTAAFVQACKVKFGLAKGSVGSCARSIVASLPRKSRDAMADAQERMRQVRAAGGAA